MAKNLVIIGAGMASGRFLEELLDGEGAGGDWNVTLFGAEPHGNYNRIMLSPVLAGEIDFAETVTHDADWYRAHGVTCRFGETVTHIDRAGRRVIGARGAVPYDRLVIATGSSSVRIPIQGNDLPGVVGFRDLSDVEAMLEVARRPGTRAVVIGGGLLGLEAAAALRARGMEVRVLHLMGHLMERQLDASAAYLLQKELEGRGIRVQCNAHSQAILGKGRVEAVLTEDGALHPADLVVMAAGIRPETRLAVDAGLRVERGIVVDDRMQTSDPAILALGECAEHDGVSYGLVAPLYDMARVAARALNGEAAAFAAPVISTRLKVSGVDLFSAGEIEAGDGAEEIVFRDPAWGVYKKLVLRDDRIAGILMYGDVADSAWFFEKLKSGESIAEMRDVLILGPAGHGAGIDPLAAVAAMPAEAEICGCNGVCKGEIVAAIEAGASDPAAIRAATGASGSCGGCAGLVEQVLAVTLGDQYDAAAAVAPAGICPCTDLGHDEIRRIIRARELKSIPAVMQEAGWKTSCGCHICRPALNYYLMAEWPLEYRDDPQSRFVNERNHANIQKDGTYSVVPRMWGGITTPAELRAIADAAEKYDVPTIHVTGGQRIDLLGVRREDLPDIWADLNAAGLVSGHAYAKGLRTVKTCVGANYCRFGTQDSTGLGIRLEKILWGSWTPHKVKLAVSGCPRNCAEATCKDVGIVCTEAGYEIGVAGAAGMEVKKTEPLAKTADEQEAIDLAVAFIQLYRENARYGERPHKWVGRVGMDWVRARVVDDAENRAALVARFELSQSVYRTDPWAEQARPEMRPRKWAPLADLTMEAAQ